MNHNYTFFISALPSFTEGMARTLDLGATLDDYNDSPNPHLADFIAMRNDWFAVGSDLRAALTHYASDEPNNRF